MKEAALKAAEDKIATIDRRTRKERRQGDDRRDRGFASFHGVARRMTLDRRKRNRDRRLPD